MLAQKIEGEERAIYYVSKHFVEHEAYYTPLEKISLALVWASKRLRHYMLTHLVHCSSANGLDKIFATATNNKQNLTYITSHEIY